jgi:hypothetical protein
MTTLITLLLLMSPQAAVPKTASPPSLIVQLVDGTWRPIYGATVTVKPSSGRENPSIGQTDYAGYAKFWVAGDQVYAIEARLTGFKTKGLKHVYLSTPDGTYNTAYIQLRLKSSERPSLVY